MTPKKFWEQINGILPSKNKQQYINLFDHTNNEDINTGDTADYINNYFSEIGPNLAKAFSTPWSFDGTHIHESVPNFETTTDEITELCNEIEIHKSSAIDLLSSRVLKDVFCILVNQLTHLIKLIFRNALSLHHGRRQE